MSRASRIGAMARVLIGFAIVAGGVAGLVKPSLPAFAQATTSLSADQIAAIDTAVQTAIADIDPNLTGAARAQAVSQALAQVATSEINLNGAQALAPVISAAITAGVPAPQAIAPILPVATNLGISAATAVNDVTLGAVSAGASPVQTAEAVIAVGAQNSVSASSVGSGLGQATATLSSSNPTAATQIGVVVSNEGTLGTGQAFGASVLAGGGSAQLASLGVQNPNEALTTGAIGNTTNTRTNTTTTDTTTATLAAALTNAPTISLATGASQQISAVGTTITCTTPSCN